MIYAPVLISTVNRYQHFKDCIESLSRCTWADKTDVFVAVDYPPSEKYWEGYHLIKKYLDSCGDLGFHSLNRIYRETNYFYSERGNLTSLRNEVFKTYDRCIVTEDDNIFSPNFLVYMNKGLELFKDDSTILAINGYNNFYPFKKNKNTFMRQNVYFSAWGYGSWREKHYQYVESISLPYLQKKFSMSTLWRLKKNGWDHVAYYLSEFSKDRIPHSDWEYNLIMSIEQFDVVSPVLSLVRNNGWDETGVNCSPLLYGEIAEKHMNQVISTEKDFIYKGSGKEYYEENREIYKSHTYSKVGIMTFVKILIKFIYHVIRILCQRKKI